MEKLSIYHYIIFLGIVIGLVRYQRLHWPLRSLALFLPATLFVECVTPFKLIHFHGNNHWFFNIFTTLEFLYYSLLFYLVFEDNGKRKLILILASLLLVFTSINILYIQGPRHFHTISYRVGAVMVVSLSFLYFKQIMQSSGYINLIRNPFFWIATGVLFFYLGFIFYFSAFDYIAYSKIPSNKTLWEVISTTLNVLLYTCFVIALLCSKPKVK